jgi:multidrug efflux pump subunit AcrA (membrane-fusion protein)
MTHGSRSAWLLVGVVAILVLSLIVLGRRSPAAVGIASVAPANTPTPVVAGPGVTEPRSESIRIGAEVDGKLARSRG